MKVGGNVQGIGEMLKVLQALGGNVDEAKDEAIDQVATDLKEAMQSFAAAGHPEHPEVQTGDLVSSIDSQHTGTGTARVGVLNDPGYAKFVEYGHSQEPGRFVPAIGKRLVQSFVPAYPFFRPAVTAVIESGQAVQTIIEVLDIAIAKAAAMAATF